MFPVKISCCPVQHLLAYIQARGDNPAPPFQMFDGSPVPRPLFYAKLSAIIKLIRLLPRGTRATSSVSGLHPMRLIRVCLTLKFESWGAGDENFLKVHSHPVYLQLALVIRQRMLPRHLPFNDRTDQQGQWPFHFVSYLLWD